MFGGKKEPQYPWNEPAGQARYEYYTIAVIGIEPLNKAVNELAARGWEMFGGCMAGTAHYAYMRREMR